VGKCLYLFCDLAIFLGFGTVRVVLGAQLVVWLSEQADEPILKLYGVIALLLFISLN
jgi:hypothetical protein